MKEFTLTKYNILSLGDHIVNDNGFLWDQDSLEAVKKGVDEWNDSTDDRIAFRGILIRKDFKEIRDDNGNFISSNKSIVSLGMYPIEDVPTFTPIHR